MDVIVELSHAYEVERNTHNVGEVVEHAGVNNHIGLVLHCGESPGRSGVEATVVVANHSVAVALSVELQSVAIAGRDKLKLAAAEESHLVGHTGVADLDGSLCTVGVAHVEAVAEVLHIVTVGTLDGHKAPHGIGIVDIAHGAFLVEAPFEGIAITCAGGVDYIVNAACIILAGITLAVDGS